jgi:hypothetical protein
MTMARRSGRILGLAKLPPRESARSVAAGRALAKVAGPSSSSKSKGRRRPPGRAANAQASRATTGAGVKKSTPVSTSLLMCE